MTSSTTFGTLLRQLRKRAGMTQGDFAAAVGYSISFVCDLEQNRRLPAVAVVLEQFVPALGLQEEAGFAAHLVELAALARDELLPATMTVQRTTQLTVTETFSQPSHLPAPPTELLGREHAIKTLCNRLQGHSGRLLTLVGPPGVGKTRLGLEVASRLEPLFADGARFVPLATISDPEFVATTIASQLELPDNGKQSPQARLIQGLRQKKLLLLLDNFEQIIASAPLLATLLTECPGIYLLVTSRERLHLRAEQRFPVPPLDLDFAVALFVQQAQAVDPAFEPTTATLSIIAQICRRLDCLPLAIELIAARIDLFSPQSMLTRLQERRLDLLADGAQDVPERHRTLRTAIQYSYALLEERERSLFRTLGVFVDGFDLAAVGHFGFDAETLQALINKSLVHLTARSVPGAPNVVAERRFLLLETLREYAREQLTVNQEADWLQRQHAAYYLQVAETAEPELHGSQAKVWLGQLETEHNNMRAALAWALAMDNAETALRLTGGLGQFWRMRGHAREGKTWLAKSLAMCADAPIAVQAKVLMEAGILDSMLGNNTYAQTFFEQSLNLYREVNDTQGVACVLLNLGDLFYATSAYQQARSFYQKSLALYQQLEDELGIADIYTCLGWLAVRQGDYEQARTHFVQGLALRRERGDDEVVIDALKGLAFVDNQQHDYRQAIANYEELLVRSQHLEDPLSIAVALNDLGRTALYQGDLAQAITYLTESFSLAQELDYPWLMGLALANQGNVAFEQSDYVQAIRFYTQSLEIAHKTKDKSSVATMFERLAGAVGAQKKAERATKLLGAAANFRVMIGVPLLASDRPGYQQIIAAPRTQLGETAYTSAYATGCAMTADQAVAFALAQFDTWHPLT